MKADEVIAFLNAHPHFFQENPGLLENLVVPHPHSDRAISLSERQMVVLRDKNRQLERKIAELISYGEQNDSISSKVHRLAVGLTTAATLPTVLHLVHFHLRDDFAIPIYALCLWQEPSHLTDQPEFLRITPELQPIIEGLNQPYCGRSNPSSADWFGELQADRVRSQALIPLRSGGTSIGVIALGSEDPQRFHGEMGVLYLERLGELISATLARTT